jgi:hypothetical protein
MAMTIAITEITIAALPILSLSCHQLLSAHAIFTIATWLMTLYHRNHYRNFTIALTFAIYHSFAISNTCYYHAIVIYLGCRCHFRRTNFLWFIAVPLPFAAGCFQGIAHQALNITAYHRHYRYQTTHFTIFLTMDHDFISLTLPLTAL